VDPLALATTPPDLPACDDDFDGFTAFDFTNYDTLILNGQDSTVFTVTYHTSQADADANSNPLASPYINTISNQQPIYARVEQNAFSLCYSTTQFNLNVIALPSLVSPTILEVCDDGTPDGLTEIDITLKDDEIRGGNSNYSISYHVSQSDADLGISSLTSPYTNTSNPQTLYVRGEDIITGCHSITTLDLGVTQAAVAFTPAAPIEYCDPDSDGFGTFDLTALDAEISGGAAGVTVTYHETQSDAENGVNALASPYNNIVIDTQIIYARVESATVLTDCATIIDLTLKVSPTPQLSPPTALALCDDNTDEVVQFNLNNSIPGLLDGIALSDVAISFYETEANAALSTNAISTPMAYSNLSNPQLVWVRVEYVSTGCEKLSSLELIVNPLPIISQPTPLAICDDSVADALTAFDLTQKNTEITLGDGSLEVVYYTTLAAAESATNAIADPTAYTNEAIGTAAANPQTLYVRVTDLDSGCYDLTTLTIRVLPNPTPSPAPADLELCDDTNSGDGEEVFDLTTEEVFILNGELGVSASYHETLAAAESGTNAIANPGAYTNIETPVQTIYVRVTNTLTGCYALVDFDIIVHPLPRATAVGDLIACELNTDDVYEFDLEAQSSTVLGSQDPSIVEVSYHTSLADAALGINFLGSPYANNSDPELIYVSVFNTATGCRNTQLQFSLEVHEAAQATAPLQAYILCDDNVETDGDPSNDRVQFDLSTQDGFVLDGQDPLNYIVSYYASQADADQAINALPMLYENGVNPQVVIARVDNDIQVLNSSGALVDSSICYETAQVTLEVNPLPIVIIDPEYILCVDTNGTEVLAPLVIDTDLSAADYTFVWADAGGAVVGSGSSYAPTQGGSYSLEVFDATLPTLCAAPIEVFTVIESNPPMLTAQVVTAAFASTHVIEASATGQGIYEYSLDQGPWGDSGTFIDVTPGTHLVTARDVNGCGETKTEVYVIDFPLYFTPNGDGYNDRWNIVGVANQGDAKIHIFDRYGKLLKQISPSGEGWDGTYNGVLMPATDYWFSLEYTDPTTGNLEILRAHFTLKR
jgi:gliding motility-associated-like protein